MKIRLSMTVLFFAGSLLLIGPPSIAHATLGQPAASVAADAAQMNASEGVNTARPLPGLPAQEAPTSANFAVERMTTPEGTVVSEYIGQSGTVFAVTWRGPTPPDVATLLGTYFKQYSDAANSRRARFARTPCVVGARERRDGRDRGQHGLVLGTCVSSRRTACGR